MRHLLAGLMLALLWTVLAAADLQAQSLPVAIELRGGGTIPVYCLMMCADGSSGGPAWLGEAGIELRPPGPLSVYGTYARYQVDEGDPDPNTGSGLGLGLRVGATDPGRISSWARVGYIRHRRTMTSSVSDPPGTGTRIYTTTQTAYGWGWELGAGLAVRMLHGLAITPGIRFQSYPVPVEGRTLPLHTNLLTLDVGIRLNP